MSRAQVERWAAEHPTAPHTGKIFEIRAGYLLPRIGLGLALAGVLFYGNRALFWNYKPETLSPEFVNEAKKIGNVAQRMNGPPVFLNPFSNRIPGSIRGPEDIKEELR